MSFLRDGIGEGVVILRDDDEGSGAADYIFIIVAIEVGLEREDGQAVDADAGCKRGIAGERHRAAAVVRAVAGNIDDAPARLKWTRCKQRRRVIDGAADGGAAAEEFARRTFDGRCK